MRDFIDHIKEKNKKKKSGCLGTLLFFVLGGALVH